MVLRIAVVAVSHREEEQEEQAWQPEFLISPGQDVRHHSLCSHDPAGERRNSGHGLMIVASSWKGWSWSTRDLPEFSYSSIQLMQQNSIPSIEYIYIYIYIYMYVSLSLSLSSQRWSSLDTSMDSALGSEGLRSDMATATEQVYGTGPCCSWKFMPVVFSLDLAVRGGCLTERLMPIMERLSTQVRFLDSSVL